ncbi:unnamed protein product [Diatraea saccharalis]|uniref:Non-homologous end-joining factor 1 n=1 Tax=Diatraea saccharalis TaxID=40085 RepID=A0A9N9RFB0_9NEOP|nr:unnamed protein product [Diatraea saccharalis]
MWKDVKDTCFYLSYSDICDYEVFVTDYLSIWYVRLPRLKFLQCLKDSNTLLHMKDDVMVNKAVDILSNPNDIKNANTKVETNSLTLTMTKQFGYTFKLILNLSEGSRELFFLKITQPLIQNIQQLKDNEAELCDLLMKKDQEIKKLRTTGQTHSHEETVIFNRDTFLRKHNDYYRIPDKLPSTVLDKVVFAPETVINVKPESLNGTSDVKFNIKAEPNSQITDTLTIEQIANVKDENEPKVKRELSTNLSKERKKIKKLNF